MSTTFLSSDEVRDLTSRIQRRSQCQTLAIMGIEYKMRPDGSPAVMRTHVEQVMGVKANSRARRPTEPNFGALDAKAA